MVADDGGVRLDQLKFDRQPDLEIQATDPCEQPIEIGRRSRLGQAGAVSVRIQAGTRAPPEVQQERLDTDGRGVLGEGEHRLPVVVSERRCGGVEDHPLVMSRLDERVGADGPPRSIQPVATRTTPPTASRRLPDTEHDFTRLQELSTTEIGPAIDRPLSPVLDGATESHVRLPDLTAAKSRSGHRQSYAGWSVVETPMIQTRSLIATERSTAPVRRTRRDG